MDMLTGKSLFSLHLSVHSPKTPVLFYYDSLNLM